MQRNNKIYSTLYRNYESKNGLSKKKKYNVIGQVLQNIIIVAFFIVYTKKIMLKFFKESFRELGHVVWLTREETKKYFIIVLLMLIVFGLYLFIVNTFFSEILFGLRDIINPHIDNNNISPNFNVESLGTGILESENNNGILELNNKSISGSSVK